MFDKVKEDYKKAKEEKNMASFIVKCNFQIMGMLLIFMFFYFMANPSDSSYSGYSHEYKTNSNYRKSVDSVADTYGISPKEADRKIKAVTGGE